MGQFLLRPSLLRRLSPFPFVSRSLFPSVPVQVSPPSISVLSLSVLSLSVLCSLPLSSLVCSYNHHSPPSISVLSLSVLWSVITGRNLPLKTLTIIVPSKPNHQQTHTMTTLQEPDVGVSCYISTLSGFRGVTSQTRSAARAMATSKYKNVSKLFKSVTTAKKAAAVKKTAKASVKSSSSRIPPAKDEELRHFFSSLRVPPSSTIHNSNSTKPQHLDRSITSLIQSDTENVDDHLLTAQETCALLNGSLSLEQINDEKPLEKILDNPWYPSTSSDQMLIMRKTMTRDKKQKWIHKNTQGYFIDQLVNTCVQSLGTDTAFETFGRLGRETGEKEYNAIIKRCIEQAKLCDSDDESLDKFMKAYKFFKGMKEQGFAIQEGTYGPLLTFLAEKGMVQVFHSVCDVIGGDSSKFPRLGYYEMMMWIKLGDQKKIHELCDVSIGDGLGKSKLLENYLLAFCESYRKAELVQLLNAVDITRVSSSCSASIFKALGRLSLDSFVEKFLFALKTSDSGAKDIGSCIFNYIASIPNLEVEDAILEFKNVYMKLDLTPSSASFETIVTYCCQCGKVYQALDLVDEMREAGLTLTVDMMHAILNASANFEFNLVHRIYSIICEEDDLKPNIETFGLLITLYVRMKDFKGAYRMLKTVEEMNLNPTSNMYNTIMAGYFKEKNVKGALMVLEKMKLTGTEPDSITYSYLILNCDCERDIVKYYEELKSNIGVQITKHVYMALINAYASCGQFEKAKQVVLDLGKVSAKLLIEVKSVLASSLAIRGQSSDALEIYEEIKQAGLKLEPKAAINVIDNIQLDGELSRLLELLKDLEGDPEYWVDGCWRAVLYCVRFKHLSITIDLFTRLKDFYSNDEIALEFLFDEAFSLIAEMGNTHLHFGLDLLQDIKVKLDMFPSRKCLDFLLTACVEAKDLKSSVLIWKEYQKADLPYNVLSYIRMYQAYLASGDIKSANGLLSNISKDDYPHVSHFIEACKKTYISKKKKKLKPKQKLSVE
ncbi:hypothetical protein ACFE04_008928 [Oxalis oulophora]